MGAVIVAVEDDCGAVRILKALFGLKGKAERFAGDNTVTEGTETVIQIGLQDESCFSCRLTVAWLK